MSKNGMEIKMRTINDEPSLCTGEFLLDKPNNIMYVGYAGNGEIDYRGQVPAKIITAVISGLLSVKPPTVETNSIKPDIYVSITPVTRIINCKTVDLTANTNIDIIGVKGVE